MVGLEIFSLFTFMGTLHPNLYGCVILLMFCFFIFLKKLFSEEFFAFIWILSVDVICFFFFYFFIFFFFFFVHFCIFSFKEDFSVSLIFNNTLFLDNDTTLTEAVTATQTGQYLQAPKPTPQPAFHNRYLTECIII